MTLRVVSAVLALTISVSGGVLPKAPPSEVILYDLRYTQSLNSVLAWEHQHIVTALGGIVNRNTPRLYSIMDDTDTLWYDYATGEGKWLNQTTFTQIDTLNDLLLHFKSDIKGAVVWSPAVPATSLVASTAAGVEDFLPIMHGGNLSAFITNKTLSVELQLLNLTSKNDAYRWAMERYLVPGMCNPRKLGYYVDAWSVLNSSTSKSATYVLTKVTNHDYFISNRAFFFDLSLWDDERPVDDPDQPLGTDYDTALRMLNSTYNLLNGTEMVHVGGFTPWYFKYTHDGPNCPNCKHGGVETEDQTMFIFTSFNCFDDGDACCIGAMTNSAFWQHFPLPHTFKQAPLPTLDDLERKNLTKNGTIIEQAYCSFYAGDYDGGAWVYSQLIKNWNDTNRGKVPIGWAIDSELSMRFPIIFPYLYETRTDNDVFIMGDSGAGYLNPTQLFPPRKISNISQSGAPLWADWNTKYYTQFNISLTGFIINGKAGAIQNQTYELFKQFSAQGVVAGQEQQKRRTGEAWLYKNMPIFQHTDDLPSNSTDAINVVINTAKAGPKLGFYFHRTILKSATFMSEVAEGSASSCKWVDPYVLSLLAQLTV